MSKNRMNKQEILERREEILAQYSKQRPKSKKLPLLTKKNRKLLGMDKDCGKAKSALIRISPDKVRIVINLVRGMDLHKAIAVLTYTNKAASPHVIALLKSAEANAVNNNGLNSDLLYIADIQAGEGPTMKRWIPRGKGSAGRIMKRTSRISVVLREREEKLDTNKNAADSAKAKSAKAAQ